MRRPVTRKSTPSKTSRITRGVSLLSLDKDRLAFHFQFRVYFA